MRIRRSSRLILLDQENRVLLFKVEDAAVSRPERPLSPIFWITPGGGVEDGESGEDAVRRELWEETGIVDFELGSLVAISKPVINLAGKIVQAHDCFYLTRVIDPVVSLDNLAGWDLDSYRDHRWWTVEELLATDELVFPLGLGSLLARIIAGETLLEPVELD